MKDNCVVQANTMLSQAHTGRAATGLGLYIILQDLERFSTYRQSYKLFPNPGIFYKCARQYMNV